jgi:hypothetical protein
MVLSVMAGGLIVFLLCNRYGDDWEEHVRDGLYAISGDSIPDFDVDKVDSLGVPFTYYPTQNGITPGNQYNATIVCNYALKYYDSLAQYPDPATRDRFFHCVSWLQQNMERNDDYALFLFRWQQPCMTSGLAMQVFLNANLLQPDSALLRDAALLLRGFAIPVEAGGFTYKEPAGWWYEEIADTGRHTPRILDGHMFAMLGLHHYYRQTGSQQALRYFKEGERALKHYLPAYDAGHGEIRYDVYGKLADKKYKHIITGQLEQLFQISADSVYWQYFRQWRAPMEKPYVYRAIRDRNRSGLVLVALLWFATAAVVYAVTFAGVKVLRKKK